MESIFNQTASKGYEKFFGLIKDYLKIDKDKFKEIFIKENEFINKNNESERSAEMSKLEVDWYKSIESGFQNPLYEIYSKDFYTINPFMCWAYYSRKYILMLKKYDFGKINSVLDLGCGIGYSTMGLKETFNEAEVYGTQIKDSIQYQICKELFKGTEGINLIEDAEDIKRDIDFVFASEYFEHFLDPVSHLEHVIKSVNPKFLVFANAFNTKSLGHFTEYLHKGETIDQKDISRIFLKELKELGYEKIETGFWNNRPRVYKRVQ